MPPIHAIYEDGVFKPLTPVELPERVEVEVRVVSQPNEPNPSYEGMDEIYKVLSEGHDTGITDLAERHNELDPRATSCWMRSALSR